MILAVKDLHFGVSRPQGWWDGHPEYEEGYQLLKKSIQEEGIKDPLFVVKQKDNWYVEIGNQRLRACLELGIPKVYCEEIRGF